jgi:hypothetical protein
MTPEQREVLFAGAREASTDQRTWAEAEQQWVEVIEAYRSAVATARLSGTRDRQMLARSLWRYGMLLLMRGRPAAGLDPAREAVALFEEVDTALGTGHGPVTSPARDEALADRITAMVDLAEISFAAGEQDARLELLDRALGVGLRAAGPPPTAGRRTRRAMGTGYHNLAVALSYAHTQRPSPDRAREAALAASRAVELRQNLIDPADALTGWELANTYLVFARCLVLIQDLDRAELVLKPTGPLIAMLEPAGGELTAQLRQTASLVADARSAARTRRRRF